jgi:hypothetical protein
MDLSTLLSNQRLDDNDQLFLFLKSFNLTQYYDIFVEEGFELLVQ